MEIQFSKHVKITINLNIGDKVVSDYSNQLKGQELIIEDIKQRIGSSQSGFVVKVDKINRYIDSDWFNKVQ